MVAEKKPNEFYFPKEMRNSKAVKLLQKYGSIVEVLKAQGIRKPTKEETDYFWLRVCEERYIYDYEFFANSCQTIITKDTAEEKSFILNLCQRDLHEIVWQKFCAGEEILLQILKAKQQGFSTYIQMFMQYVQTIHEVRWNSVICAHVRDAAINVRAMYKDAIRMMPAIDGKKMTMHDFERTQNIQIVPQRGTRITIGIATEPENVRSQNLKMVHLSEEAFFPETEINNPKKIEGALNSSRSHGRHTMFVRESTANGVGGFFYDQWQLAKDDKTAFYPHFSAWYNSETKEILFDGTYYQHNGKKKKGTISDFIADLNEYELNLWKNNKRCTLENLNWYRLELATSPSIEMMRQENPSNDIEAFQNSGTPVFKHEQLRNLYNDCCPPEFAGEFISDCAPEIAFVEVRERKNVLQNIRFIPDAELTEIAQKGAEDIKFKRLLNKIQIWEQPDTKQKITDRYIVVFDPQKGQSEGADYGVIKVIDRYWRMYGEGSQISAMFYGHKNMYVTIWIAAQMAKYYNNALLVVESNIYDSNNNKVDFNEYIFETVKDYYDNLYKYKTAEKSQNTVDVHYGFPMLRNTKSAIIENYRQIIAEHGYIERDKATIDEALTYECKKDGNWGAIAGKHDDRIMATMIGLYIDYQLELPKKINSNATDNITVKTAW